MSNKPADEPKKERRKVLLYGSDDKPLIEIPEGEATKQAEQELGPQFPPTPPRLLQGVRRIIQKTWKTFLIGLALLTFWQLVVFGPMISIPSFGAMGGNRIAFIIHNPFIVPIHDVQVAWLPGPAMIVGGDQPQDLREPFMRMGKLTECQRLQNPPDLVDAARRFDAMDEITYRTIPPGGDVTFPTGLSVHGKIRADVAVGVHYKIAVLSLPVWTFKTQCSEFQAALDADGHVHLVPYSEEKSRSK